MNIATSYNEREKRNNNNNNNKFTNNICDNIEKIK